MWLSKASDFFVPQPSHNTFCGNLERLFKEINGEGLEGESQNVLCWSVDVKERAEIVTRKVKGCADRGSQRRSF